MKIVCGMIFLCGSMMLAGGGLGRTMSVAPIEEVEAIVPIFCRLVTNPVGNDCIGRWCLFGGVCGTYSNGMTIYCDCQ